MKELLTPKQVALAIGVSEASLKRWCDKGLLPVIRTAGGHRRLPINGIMQFLRKTGQNVVRPEVLGLPATIGKGGTVLGRGRRQLVAALETGDEEQVRRILFDLYLAGNSVSTLGDDVIASAFRDLGQRWQHGDIEVYQERRGCEVMVRVLNQLRLMLATPDEGAPVAIGGGVETDPYVIPKLLVEMTLLDAGWRARYYGTGLPIATMCAAIEECRPELFWLSVSWVESQEAFVAQYERLYETVSRLNIALAVGGSALTRELRSQLRYAAYCDTLGHLLSFTETLYKRPA